MKYLLIGDLHGKKEVMFEALSSTWDEYQKVFLGDYVDSFDRSAKDQIEIVQELLRATGERFDVTALIGNHELSYLKEGMQCSGHRSTTKFQMTHLKNHILQRFKTHLWLTPDILVTHAGATEGLFKSINDLKVGLEADSDELYRIGQYRGGNWPTPGIFWCDYWHEFEEILGVTQVVGHSAHRPEGEIEGVVNRGSSWNIDCLDRVREALTVEVHVDKPPVFEVVTI